MNPIGFTLEPLKPDEFNEVYQVFKHYMKPVIDLALGWEDHFQEEGFKSNLNYQWFSWVYVKNERAGVLCYREKNGALHIHLLVVFDGFQRKGIAKMLMNGIQQEAERTGKGVTLSCFKNNLPAIALYESLGFQVIDEDEYFFRYRK